MPAITPVDPSVLPVLEESDGHAPARAVDRHRAVVVRGRRASPSTVRSRSPAPTSGATDPFLMLDEMGPIQYGPGEAKGAPDHPHRGFETVTYLFDGEMEHRDSTGGGGLLRGGDTQWMTAGAGLVHSEEPTAAMLRDGGLDARPPAVGQPAPRRQAHAAALPGPERRQDHARAHRRRPHVVAARRGRARRPVRSRAARTRRSSTRTPRSRRAASSRSPGPATTTRSSTCCAAACASAATRAPSASTSSPCSAATARRVVIEADEDADVLLLGGRPLHEPVAWYGPFVMNTKQEILESLDLFETRASSGRSRPARTEAGRRRPCALRGGAGRPRRASQSRRAEGRLTAPSPGASEHPAHSVWQGSRSRIPGRRSTYFGKLNTIVWVA